jgi:F-type H+-transporting ATPase subunit delta
MNSAHEITEGLLQLLEKRGQIAALPEVIAQLTEYQAKQSRYNVAVIRTAVELRDSERELIKKQLSEMFGRHLQIEEHIDESIIGGMYIQVGDTVIDYTVSAQLKQITEQLEK